MLAPVGYADVWFGMRFNTDGDAPRNVGGVDASASVWRIRPSRGRLCFMPSFGNGSLVSSTGDYKSAVHWRMAEYGFYVSSGDPEENSGMPYDLQFKGSSHC